MTKIKFILLTVFVISISGLPVIEKKEDVKKEETKKEGQEQGDDWELSLEYGRYLKEVVQALESDPEFRKKLEKADVEDIKSGKIARELHFVDHNVRSKLDELKRRELERLRHIAIQEHEKKNGIDRSKMRIPVHIDHKNPNSFESEDLKKLILQLNKDLEEVDKQRQDEFKRYEMQKEYEYKHKLATMDDDHQKVEIKQHEEELKKHKEHPRLHHPGSKQQLEEVWEEQDHMKAENFDPRTFFHVHDLDGNGYWDENEVKALFQKELDKMYDPNAPEDDLMERYEEMERMREHVFGETDRDKDNLISFDEFVEQTKRSDFERDEGWQGLDEQDTFSQQEYEAYEHQRQQEIQQLIESGAIPPPPGYHGINPPQPLHIEAALQGMAQVPHPSQGLPQGYQAVPQGYQGVPQGYQAVPQGYQAVPPAYQSVPQGYQAVPQGYQAMPQGYQAVPQGYQAVPQGYQAMPQGPGVAHPSQGAANVEVAAARPINTPQQPHIHNPGHGQLHPQGVPHAQVAPNIHSNPEPIAQLQALPSGPGVQPQVEHEVKKSSELINQHGGAVLQQQQQDNLNQQPKVVPVASNHIP